MPVTDTGGPITVPVGEGTLGRIFNVTGDPVDNRGPVRFHKTLPDSSQSARLSPSRIRAAQILETGIKVIDLICPFTKGGKVGAFGGAGVGKTVVILSSSTTSRRTTAVSPFSRGWGERSREGNDLYTEMSEAG
jgi:F-type H+-transporting ATPase subunit beta